MPLRRRERMRRRLQAFANWLTARRIRAQAIVLAICFWTVAPIDFATPGMLDRAGNIKFQDFLPFYVSARQISQGRAAELFNPSVAARESNTVLDRTNPVHLTAAYGPQVFLLFVPFNKLPFLAAATVWVGLSAAIYFSCCYFVWKACPNLRRHGPLLALSALAYPPFFHLVVRGQISSLVLLCFVAAYFGFRGGHDFLAGLALGSLVLKPQFLIGLVAVMLAARSWRCLTGIVVAIGAQLGFAWAYFGPAVMQAYGATLWHVRQLSAETEPGIAAIQMHSLRAFWSLLVPWPGVALGLYVLCCVMIVALAVQTWRSGGPIALRFSALVLAAVLVNPHLFVYDLLVLAPAFIVLVEWALEFGAREASATVLVMVYFSCMLPLIGPLSRWTRLQLSVLALAGVQWLLWKIVQGDATHKNSVPLIA